MEGDWITKLKSSQVIQTQAFEKQKNVQILTTDDFNKQYNDEDMNNDYGEEGEEEGSLNERVDEANSEVGGDISEDNQWFPVPCHFQKKPLLLSAYYHVG